jgi:LAO/AO transport system kinase
MKALPKDLAQLSAGGKAMLARVLSALETSPRDPDLAALLDAASNAPRGVVVGLTGPPGVGKSTLTTALIARLRAQNKLVAVVAVDPSSRQSGGALLGDRTRIETDPEDAGAFVRSMAARRRLGGLADLTYPAAVLMRALFDMVIVETVGIGQSETEIADCADIVVFCAQPGSGDALQYMKAGVMEVPDIVLVTKGDLGAPARRAAADVKTALSLSGGDGGTVDVGIVSSRTGEGLDVAIKFIAARACRLRASGALASLRAARDHAWAEAHLCSLFGQVGLAAIRDELSAATDQFGAVARLSSAAERVISAALAAR